jgi:hypothetical protein
MSDATDTYRQRYPNARWYHVIGARLAFAALFGVGFGVPLAGLVILWRWFGSPC